MRVRWLLGGLSALVLVVGVSLGLWAALRSAGTPTDAVPTRTSAATQSPGTAPVSLAESARVGIPRTDGATIGEAARAEVQRAETATEPGGVSPPAAGGRTAAGRVRDSLEYAIRDASGTVKEHKVVDGE